MQEEATQAQTGLEIRGKHKILLKAIEAMNEVHKNAVEEMGFGPLLHLNIN